MKAFIILLTAFLFWIECQSQNIKITSTGKPNEPSIIMDPKNPNILVAGSNLNYIYTSSDGGNSWTTKALRSTYGVWGDPVIDVDTLGNFYFFHLSNYSEGSWIDRIVCQKSLDKGKTWSSGTFTGLNGVKEQDKQWSIIDRKNNNIYLTWTQFDKYKSKEPNDSTVILFSKSVDNGATWSATKRINKIAGDCLDGDNTVEGAVPAVGPNGEIYVAWAGPNGIVFNRSTDEGETWLDEEILVDQMPSGWDYSIPGIQRCNGLPVTKCDLSGGVSNGTIYINWSDQRNGSNDTDIWLSKSTNGGDTWSTAVKINDDDSHRHQFLTWMDIDQTNGHLYFVFYDRRNYSDTNTDVYIAVSNDGGNSFLNKRISESPFIPNDDIFFGDYTNISTHNGIIRPIWTRLHDGQLSIWTNVTPLDKLLSVYNQSAENQSDSLVQYPNPNSGKSYVSFKLHEPSIVNINLFDQQGTLILKVIDNKKVNYGKHIVPVIIDDLHLPSGIYYLQLKINDDAKTVKSLVIK